MSQGETFSFETGLFDVHMGHPAGHVQQAV